MQEQLLITGWTNQRNLLLTYSTNDTESPRKVLTSGENPCDFSVELQSEYIIYVLTRVFGDCEIMIP